ncbi:ribosome maturation factor RimM [Aliikangiella maris]|uniref:Ribosome maturation factor RimM n=2 Tax=Aliikangiella maris TaxID=3162458 RepID=A0ABV3MRG0_9GAMM
MKDSPVIIGKITGVYGVKGWVKVFSHTDPRINIIKYNPWRIRIDNQWCEYPLLDGRAQGKTIVAELKGINDRNLAESLIGREIAIDQAQLESLDENEFYWRELEGLDVLNLSEQKIGRISHLIETGANDVMVVKLTTEQAEVHGSKEMMIPYIMDDVIKKVDLQNNQILVDWDNEYL